MLTMIRSRLYPLVAMESYLGFALAKRKKFKQVHLGRNKFYIKTYFIL